MFRLSEIYIDLTIIYSVFTYCIQTQFYLCLRFFMNLPTDKFLGLEFLTQDTTLFYRFTHSSMSRSFEIIYKNMTALVSFR